MPKRILKKIKNNLSWQIATGILVLVSLAGISLVINEHNHRGQIAAMTRPAITGIPLKLSTTSQDELIEFGKSHPEVVVAVASVSVNLATNDRHTTFFYGVKPEMQTMWNMYVTHRAHQVSVYASEPDQNSRMTRIINGGLDCVPFNQTLNYKYYPEAGEWTKWLCSIAVPAGFDNSGDFVGFINIFMSRQPTDQEQKLFSKEATEISADIYKRDIVRKADSK